MATRRRGAVETMRGQLAQLAELESEHAAVPLTHEHFEARRDAVRSLALFADTVEHIFRGDDPTAVEHRERLPHAWHRALAEAAEKPADPTSGQPGTQPAGSTGSDVDSPA